jgi:hypothetical protein
MAAGITLLFCSQCGKIVRGWFCAKCGTAIKEAEREAVSASGEELWRQFAAGFYQQRHSPHLLEAADVLSEAVSCCRNGEYLATALMCRTALESALFQSRISRFEGGASAIDPEVADLIPDIQIQWRQVLRWAVRKGIIDKRLAKDAWKVRELGNFAAHLTERVMRSAFSRPGESYKLWVGAEEAYYALNITKTVLLQLNSAPNG